MLDGVDWDFRTNGMEYPDRTPEEECDWRILTCGKCQWCCVDEIRDSRMIQ